MGVRSPSEIRAESALDRALDGGLYEGDERSLQVRNTGTGRRFRINLPKRGCENLSLEKGQQCTPFVDLENKAIVFVFDDE